MKHVTITTHRSACTNARRDPITESNPRSTNDDEASNAAESAEHLNNSRIKPFNIKKD